MREKKPGNDEVAEEEEEDYSGETLQEAQRERDFQDEFEE